ncbi:MAG TPA: hypothetical protein VFQ76_08900, partial [Longimicrobiaceae bacterium]|nr:hypothetical protein [Longimicrobiaceae bacterium]
FLSTTADGLVWDQGNEAAGIHHVGAFLEDIDLMTWNRDASGQSARDLVVLQSWLSFAINRVRLYAANRYNLRVNDCVNISVFHLESLEAGTSNLYVGSAVSEGYSTTVRFVGCYFQGTQSGPGADVAGYGLSFEQCIFESCGRQTGAGSYGCRVRWGTAVFVTPYFENNPDWEIIAGTVLQPGNQGTAVTVINPTITPGAKVEEAGGVRFERGTATVIGGNFGPSPHPISFSNGMDHVYVAAKTYPGKPEVDSPGSLKTIPGTVLYTDPPSGQLIQTGLAGYEIGGGDLIKKHISVQDSTTVPNPLMIPFDAVASYDIYAPGTSYGDTVAASMATINGVLPIGTLISASAGNNFVRVTIFNRYPGPGGTITLVNPVVRVDVWKH